MFSLKSIESIDVKYLHLIEKNIGKILNVPSGCITAAHT